MVSINSPSIKTKACLTTPILQAQTLEQRRRNAKFAKDQENKMGKSEDQLKKRTKETPKSPISIFWLGTSDSKFELLILSLR